MRAVWPLRTENALDGLLRRCYSSPRCPKPRKQQAAPLEQRRCYASTDASPPPAGPPLGTHEPVCPRVKRDIAVIGGGITGLASAYFLSRYLPASNITLYEGADELGGWVRTKSVNVGNGEVVFEQGPRTLRPHTTNGKLTLDLIGTLGLQDEIITTPKISDAARSRFIYYPDHLVRMPGRGQGFAMLANLFREPALRGLVPGVLGENWRERRAEQYEDESVHSFVSRRLSPHIADNVVSAVFHGIYAGDIRQLSAQSLMFRLREAEWGYGSVVKELASLLVPKKGLPLSRLPRRDVRVELYLRNERKGAFDAMKEISVYTFKKGLGTLTDGLVAALRRSRNVTIRTNTRITGIRPNTEMSGVTLSTAPGDGKSTSRAPPASYTHALSTVSARALSKMSQVPLPSLADEHSVTVMVVNLFYPDPNALPVHGFGYLIPRSAPLEQNPERALGVVFDSDATQGQDTATGTKVTVMLGGHWWDDFDVYPDAEEGVKMARDVLARHLGITGTPSKTMVGLHRDCIPQYTVGHPLRLAQANVALRRGYGGRLRVAGNSYHGVGLNDCVRAGWEAAQDLGLEIEAEPAAERGLTGLHWSTLAPSWAQLYKREGRYVCGEWRAPDR